MIRNTCILLLMFFVASCSSTSPNVQIDKTGVYGIHFPISYTPELCHQHIGFTVFNNFANRYELSQDFVEAVEHGYEKGISSTNNSSLILNESINLDNHIKVSSWSGTPELSQEGKEQLKILGKQIGIDFLLYPTSYTSKPLEYKDQCWGIKLKTGNNNGVPFVPLYSVWVFHVHSGEYIGGSFIRNDSFPVKEPSISAKISNTEIEYYESMAAMYAEEGIRQLILGH